MSEHAWIDASAGVAGDMLLAALLDAGARPDAVRTAIEAVVPGAVDLTVTTVTRAGLRALKVDVDPRALPGMSPHRTWRTIAALLDDADLPPQVHRRARETFARLAAAEATVHGTDPDDVEFHEVGALDSIADVVGVCAALDDVGVATVTAGEVAVGSGRVRTAHGELPVPVPAVAELARGWRVRAGGAGELATPTGMALIRTLAAECADLPSMTVDTVGVGAGTRDTAERPNVVRVLLGNDPTGAESLWVLEANVDDLDPRLWPGVLAALLAAGAADAWLVPILMKKGRPAHTLTVLCTPDHAPTLRTLMFRHTSTLGVRESPRRRSALTRTIVRVTVFGEPLDVKIGHLDGTVVQVTPEFDHVAALARRLARPEREVLAEATRAATAAGLRLGVRRADRCHDHDTAEI